MNKKLLILLLAPVLLIQLPGVMAHCPLCTTGAIVGLGVARAYGVDDSIVGIFFGALIISSAMWFNKWFKKKVDFPLQEAALIIISFLLLAIPLYYKGIITNFDMVKSMPEHHGMTGLGILGLGQFGVDKLLFGMTIGSLVVWGAFSLSDSIKRERGKVLWPYQGLSFMIIALAILSLIFWSLTK